MNAGQNCNYASHAGAAQKLNIWSAHFLNCGFFNFDDSLLDFLQKCYENLKLQRIFFSEVTCSTGTEQSWFTVHCSVFYNWRNLRRPKQHFWVADQASGSNFRADFHLSNACALAKAEQVATVAGEPFFLYQTVLDYQSCPFHSLDFWININISSHTLTYLLLQFLII